MTLTRRDALATLVAALVVLVYVANTQGWWYLGSDRWAVVTMAVVGVGGCTLGARIQGRPTMPILLLGALGSAAFVVALVGVITGSHAMLLTLTIVLLALWAGTTLRHATSTPPRVAPGV